MSETQGEVGLLGLGSNVGERRVHLQAAVDALQHAGVEVLASSSVYDTDPVGDVLDQPSFLNACLRIRSALPPLDLLDVVKRIERELGRDEDGVRHGPRAIDIDILLLGELELKPRAHDAAPRAAAEPPLRADPGARARLRSDYSPWPTSLRRARRALPRGGRALGRTALGAAQRRSETYLTGRALALSAYQLPPNCLTPT